MKQYKVVIKELNTYILTIDAENAEQAERKAYDETLYVKGIPDETDSETISIEEV